MSKLMISIIGAGRLGQSLGRLIKQTNSAALGGIYCRNTNNAEKACNFIGDGIPCSSLSHIPQSSMILITTPDDHIEKVCNQFVAENINQKKNNISFLHCSGSLSSENLLTAKNKLGALTGSIHPIHSFGNPMLGVNNFPGTICSYQGDKELFPIIKNLFTNFGAREVFELSTNNKALYHVSGMFPGCLTTALMKVAKKLYLEAGVSDEIANLIIIKLLNHTADRIQSESIDGLNFDGPAARGDINTIKKHYSSLEKNGSYQSLYRDLMSVLVDEIGDPGLIKSFT